jgi:hypothetical protein
MSLYPDASLFEQCYPEWVADVAALIAKSKPGTVFGIYGPWGSGKSSACDALRPKIYDESSKLKQVVECVVINAFQLRMLSAEDAGKTAKEAIRRAITLDDPQRERSAERRLRIYGFLQKIGGHRVMSAISGMSYGDLALDVAGAIGKNEVQGERDKHERDMRAELDRVFIFIDDIDRCDPRQAVELLANINQPELSKEATVIVLCDPHVLASHVAHEFGIEMRDGFQSISKYIHAPLFLPGGSTENHKDTLNLHAAKIGGVSGELLSAARSAIGMVSIREILAALPQASLWFNFSPHKGINAASVFLFVSIAANAAPRIINVLHRETTALINLKSMVQSPSTPSGQALVMFGQRLQEDFFLRRPDIVALGRLLMKGDDSEFRSLAPILGRYSV